MSGNEGFRIVDAREFAKFLLILKLEPVCGGALESYSFTRYGFPGEDYLAEIEERDGVKTYKIRLR